MAPNIIAFLLLCTLSEIAAEFNITDAFASKCKKYYSNNGYSYNQYFKVSEHHRKDDIKFELHFAIKAPKDVHILMSAETSPPMSSSVYEIVIGAGGNTYSEIRRMRMKAGKDSRDTLQILSPTKYVALWIQIHKNGLIRFGREGEELSLLDYHDPMPLDVNYFSFATWSGVEAIILYDCPYGENVTDEITLEAKNLTQRESLIKDIFENYNTDSLPLLESDSSIPIGFLAKIFDAKFDVSKSSLYTRGYFIAEWYDARVQWNAESSDNITHLEFKHKKTWLPEIMIFEALDVSDLLQKDMIIMVKNTGTVGLLVKFTARTYCKPSPRLAHWPKDDHDCTLKFGVWTANSKIKFYSMLKNHYKSFFLNLKPTGTEWKFINLSNSSSWTNSTPYLQIYDDSEAEVHNTVNYHINVKRIHNLYTHIYYSPLLVSILVILLTFWTSHSPKGIATILCFNLLFVLFIVSQIVDQLPAYMSFTPNIVWFYIWVIIGICMRISIMVLVLAITTEPRPWTIMNDKLKRFLHTSPLSMALGVSSTQVQDDGYNGLLNYEERRQIKSEEEIIDDEWNTLVLFIDRILFFVYILGFSTMIFIHY